MNRFKDGFDRISLVPYNITAKVTRSITSTFSKSAWTNDVANIANTPISDTNPSDALIRAYQDAALSGWLGVEDMSWVFFTDGAPTAGASCRKPAVTGFKARPRIPSIWLEDQPWADYYNFKVEWNDGVQPPYKGPSALIRTDTCDAAADPHAPCRPGPPTSTRAIGGICRTGSRMATRADLTAPPRRAWLRVRTTTPLSQAVGRT